MLQTSTLITFNGDIAHVVCTARTGGPSVEFCQRSLKVSEVKLIQYRGRENIQLCSIRNNLDETRTNGGPWDDWDVIVRVDS